jgi:hypothetical protein
MASVSAKGGARAAPTPRAGQMAPKRYHGPTARPGRPARCFHRVRFWLLAAALLALDKRAEALEAEIARLKPPLHVVLGSLFPMIRQIYSGRLASWEKWEAVSDVAHGTRG